MDFFCDDGSPPDPRSAYAMEIHDGAPPELRRLFAQLYVDPEDMKHMVDDVATYGLRRVLQNVRPVGGKAFKRTTNDG